MTNTIQDFTKFVKYTQHDKKVVTIGITGKAFTFHICMHKQIERQNDRFEVINEQMDESNFIQFLVFLNGEASPFLIAID